jgi:hypothetical protein
MATDSMGGTLIGDPPAATDPAHSTLVAKA